MSLYVGMPLMVLQWLWATENLWGEEACAIQRTPQNTDNTHLLGTQQAASM